MNVLIADLEFVYKGSKGKLLFFITVSTNIFNQSFQVNKVIKHFFSKFEATLLVSFFLWLDLIGKKTKKKNTVKEAVSKTSKDANDAGDEVVQKKQQQQQQINIKAKKKKKKNSVSTTDHDHITLYTSNVNNSNAGIEGNGAKEMMKTSKYSAGHGKVEEEKKKKKKKKHEGDFVCVMEACGRYLASHVLDWRWLTNERIVKVDKMRVKLSDVVCA
ncbi:unnamed protein product [Prunus armeniaca]|uniref:Uncharacterized protein n=1 Tax=Prunus armeniaca TaxID=36596 RepID=A0A6J5VND1_PRUAR|nr:unnamed protein product [Prunus armeniaca]CAB4319749.1 unnamed protein product [Prunus armeniaca]